MKLNPHSSTLEQKMSEFDFWITPSLGEIRDTIQFKENLHQLIHGFDLLECLAKNFQSHNDCAASNLANNMIGIIASKEAEEAISIFSSVCNVLLLATGKTDNNLKCQFPLFLKTKVGITCLPQKNRAGKWIMKAIPRTLLLEDVAKLVVYLAEKRDVQLLLARAYFQLIISDEQYAKQLWSLGSAYAQQKRIGQAESLISSIVIFQSRGSITATQGHIPETILRGYMKDWGLVAGKDFNLQDVEIGELLDDVVIDNKIKKRKYDFVVPYHSRINGAKIFIQSQFYAGDSGSVSHKVVDQTDSTREATLRKYPQAVFVEYLDGAGYYSSLNGDLRKMIAKPTTKDFFQIRTAPLKLRRELQEIAFLTVLEIEHAIIQVNNKRECIEAFLCEQGYASEEIIASINEAIESGSIREDNGDLFVLDSRLSIIRKYCLLDIIANYGGPIPAGRGTGWISVPGYGVEWGLPLSEVIKVALEKVPKLEVLWLTKVEPFEDIQWLIEKGFVRSN